MKEKLVTEYDHAVTDIYNQIRGKLRSRKFLIYGHSMGSYLALRATSLLEAAGRSPICLIVSGNAGPGIPRGEDEKIRYLMTKSELKEELKSMGGVSDDFLIHDELFDFFEPILRADFEVVEKNALMNEPTVCTPIIALMGREEKHYEKIANWGNYTKGNFLCKVLPGNHFFMFHDPSELVAHIKNCHIKYGFQHRNNVASQAV